MAVIDDPVRAAYDTTGSSWAAGPERLYRLLAGLLLDAAPPVRGRLLLDAGAGTGAVSHEAVARGARVVALDVSVPMLRHATASRPPGVAASVERIPLRDGVVDVAAAGFCLNHLPEPVHALRELRRVVRPGGAVVAAVFATGNDHPAKAIVDAGLAELGWQVPAWYTAMKASVAPLLADPGAFAAVAADAGLAAVEATVVTLRRGLHDPRDIVEWRLGMAHTAAFVAGLDRHAAAALRDRLAAEVAAAGQPLRPRVVVLSSRRAA